MTNKSEKILVIRLGALGDLILCFQAFQEIRAAHPNAEIALLTMPPFHEFAACMPWFDHILIDERPPLSNVRACLDLVRRVRDYAPTRVYDLQGKTRQNLLFYALGGARFCEWSGAAKFATHPRLWPPQEGMHFTDFVAAQLRLANVQEQPPVDLNWLQALVDGFPVPEKFVVVVPSCAAGRDYKRWPVRYFAELVQRLRRDGIETIVVGTKADHGLAMTMRGFAPHLIDATGKTTLAQLATLMRHSMAVIGNDTGPTHLAGAVGAKTLALISGKVNPVWSAPKGPRVSWLQSEPMSMLGVDKVSLALEALLAA